MIYIDEGLVPKAVHDNAATPDMAFAAWSGAPVDFFNSVNPIYTELRRGLIKYQQRWGSLPQLPIPLGPTLKLGTTGHRVATLRTRLDLYDSTKSAHIRSRLLNEFESFNWSQPDSIDAVVSFEWR